MWSCPRVEGKAIYAGTIIYIVSCTVKNAEKRKYHTVVQSADLGDRRSQIQMPSLSLSTSVRVDILPHLSEFSHLQDGPLFLPHSHGVKVKDHWGTVNGNCEIVSTQ